MRLMVRTRRGIWTTAVATWVAIATSAWLMAPYGIRMAWPTSVGDNLIGFLPGEAAILVVRHPDLTSSTPDPDQERRLSRLDLRTGEIRKIVAFPENFVCSELLEGGRWLAIYRYGNDGNRVLLLEVKTGRQVELPSTTGATLPAFTESPSGRYLAYREANDLRVVDLSLDRPESVAAIPPRPGFLSFVAHQFGVDDRGHVFAVTENFSSPTGIDAVASFDLSTSGWRELRQIKIDETVNYLVTQEDGRLLLGVRSKNVDRAETLDPETGRILDTRPDAARPSRSWHNFEVDPLRNWLAEKTPWLGMAPYREEVAFRLKSRRWVTVKQSARKALADSFSTLESDEDQPYLVIADEDGVQVWDDPPTKSVRWLAATWLGSAILLAALATWRAWSPTADGATAR